jgi:hypothetical protein
MQQQQQQHSSSSSSQAAPMSLETQAHLQIIRRRSAVATLRRAFARPAKARAAIIIQRAFRRFISTEGIKAVLSNLIAQDADPSRKTRAQWMARAHLPNVRRAIKALMRMLSRVCCRRIMVCISPSAGAMMKVQRGKQPMQPMQQKQQQKQKQKKQMQHPESEMISTGECDKRSLLYSKQACPVLFAEAFFIAHHVEASTESESNAAGDAFSLDPLSKSFGIPQKQELNYAVKLLGRSPDRFSMLTSAQRCELSVAGERLVRCYKLTLTTLMQKQPTLSIETAVHYEIALAAYCDLCQVYIATSPLSASLANETELQCIINRLLLEMTQSLDRMLKRGRIIAAAIAAAPYYNGESAAKTMQTIITTQEDQIGRIVPHLGKKLSELMRILGGEPMPTPLLHRIQTGLIAVMSSLTSVKEVRLAAFAIIKTLIRHATAHHSVAYKAAASHIYAAAVRLDAVSSAPLSQDMALAATAVLASNTALLLLPQFDVASDEACGGGGGIKVDVWDVIRTNLRLRQTGVAAYLLIDAMRVHTTPFCCVESFLR